MLRPMNREIAEKLYANLTVMSLGAPLISACLRFRRSWEPGRGLNSCDVRPCLSLDPIRQRIAQSFEKALRRGKFGRKLASSES
jgi:hypothetical protein